MDCWTFTGETVSMQILVAGVQSFALDGIAVTHAA